MFGVCWSLSTFQLCSLSRYSCRFVRIPCVYEVCVCVMVCVYIRTNSIAVLKMRGQKKSVRIRSHTPLLWSRSVVDHRLTAQAFAGPRAMDGVHGIVNSRPCPFWNLAPNLSQNQLTVLWVLDNFLFYPLSATWITDMGSSVFSFIKMSLLVLRAGLAQLTTSSWAFVSYFFCQTLLLSKTWVVMKLKK